MLRPEVIRIKPSSRKWMPPVEETGGRKSREREDPGSSRPFQNLKFLQAAEMEAKAEQSTAVSRTTGKEMPTANSPPRLEPLIPCSKTGTQKTAL